MTAQGPGQCQQRGTPNEGSDPKKIWVGFDTANKGGGLLQRQHRQQRPKSGFVGCRCDVTELLARRSQGTGLCGTGDAATRPLQTPIFGIIKTGLE